ncbi:MAG: hypothetical protein JW839_09945 [Candidatus Lokiarchaeota archaeon]|nr:hypothetical protein [Candidatus Lokiarchaeota archaeon]
MIKSYLIMSSSGVPLYARSVDRVFDETLVSCFLSALQSFAKGVSHACIDKIDMDKMTFFYAFKGPIYSIVVAETADEVESRVYRIIAEKLGRSFINKYPAEFIEHNLGVIDRYSDFDVEFEQITSDFSNLTKMSQRDFVSEYFVNAASNENILGMVIYDLKKDEFIAKDIPKDISPNSFESFSAMLFNFIERLGKELKAGEINETLLRAKNYWIGAFRKGDYAVLMLFSREFFGKILPDFVTKQLDT